MELTQLKYFQAVARLGNVSKAAQELFVTQPNLSKSIARLENELGVPLFDHRRGKIVLNEYGRIFLSSVKLCLSELNTGIQTVQRLYSSSQNILSLGSPIDDILPDVLRDFSLAHPEIGIRQFDGSLEELIGRLHNRTLDLAVSPHKVEDGLLRFELLGEKEFGILVSGQHPLAGRKTIDLRELAHERFICDRTRMDEETLRQVCLKSGFEPDVAFNVESSNLVYNLVAGNSGIAFMPTSQVSKLERDFPNSSIRMLRVQNQVPNAQIGLLYHKDYVFTTAATLFADFLRDWLEKESRRVEELWGD